MEIEQILINNQYYNVIKKIPYEDTTYFYLQNDENEDLLIQKLVDGNIINLKDDEEIEKALLVYTNQTLKEDA